MTYYYLNTRPDGYGEAVKAEETSQLQMLPQIWDRYIYSLSRLLVHPDLAISLKPGEWFQGEEGYEIENSHCESTKYDWQPCTKADYKSLDGLESFSDSRRIILIEPKNN